MTHPKVSCESHFVQETFARKLAQVT